MTLKWGLLERIEHYLGLKTVTCSIIPIPLYEFSHSRLTPNKIRDSLHDYYFYLDWLIDSTLINCLDYCHSYWLSSNPKLLLLTLGYGYNGVVSVPVFLAGTLLLYFYFNRIVLLWNALTSLNHSSSSVGTLWAFFEAHQYCFLSWHPPLNLLHCMSLHAQVVIL